MKAIIRKKYGTPEVLSLDEIDSPRINSDEILVNVKATTVNRTDCGILTGKPYLIRAFTGLFKPSSLVPGTDFAGEVCQVGSNVKEYKVGDRVWGLNDEGLASHAEFIKIKADQAISIIPDSFSFTEAVACAEGAHYAYNFINKVKLKPSDKVLVNGGTGAIGSASIQLLKHLKVHVVATSNTINLERVKDLGADEVIDYEKEDFKQLNSEFEFVFDAVGKSTFGACKKILTPKGIYISSELGPWSQNIIFALFTPFLGGKKVIFPIPNNRKESITHLNKLMTNDEFKPLIDKSYKMADIKDAYKYVMTGQKIGNVILEMN